MAERRIVHPMAISNADLRQAQRHERWAIFSVVLLALAGLGMALGMVMSPRPSVDISRIGVPDMLDGALRDLHVGDQVDALLGCTVTAQNPPGSTLGLAIRKYPSLTGAPERRLADGNTLTIKNPVIVENDRGVNFFVGLNEEKNPVDGVFDHVFGRAMYLARTGDTDAYWNSGDPNCQVTSKLKLKKTDVVTGIDQNGIEHIVGGIGK